jgi:hypothetical protein
VDGRLAYELAKQSELTVIGFDGDSTRIQAIGSVFWMRTSMESVSRSIQWPRWARFPFPIVSPI